MANVHSPVTEFNYLEIPPHHWEEELSLLKMVGTQTVLLRIPWGAHETSKGMRDFSRSSRLRLEKVLKNLADQHLKTQLQFGYFCAKEMLPSWAFSASQKTTIPAQVWDKESDDVSLVEVPSLFDHDLWASFKEFSNDVVKLSALYVTPHGPVEKIFLNLKLFAFDRDLFSSEEFTHCFKELYPNFDKINSKYNVILKSSPPILSTVNYRVLYKSRPWLASFDYKICREKLLTQLKEKATSIDSARGLEDHFEVETSESLEILSNGNSAVAIDPVFLDFSRDKVFPFCPQGLISPSSAFAFRMAEYFKEKTHFHRQSFFSLPLMGDSEPFPFNFISVICGKYLTRAAYQYLEKIWMRGGTVFFPFGFPQFDEHMVVLEWAGGMEKKTLSVGESRLQGYLRGLGIVCAPMQAFSPTQMVWDEIDKIRVGFEAGGTQ